MDLVFVWMDLVFCSQSVKGNEVASPACSSAETDRATKGSLASSLSPIKCRIWTTLLPPSRLHELFGIKGGQRGGRASGHAASSRDHIAPLPVPRACHGLGHVDTSTRSPPRRTAIQRYEQERSDAGRAFKARLRSSTT